MEDVVTCRPHTASSWTASGCRRPSLRPASGVGIAGRRVRVRRRFAWQNKAPTAARVDGGVWHQDGIRMGSGWDRAAMRRIGCRRGAGLGRARAASPEAASPAQPCCQSRHCQPRSTVSPTVTSEEPVLMPNAVVSGLSGKPPKHRKRLCYLQSKQAHSSKIVPVVGSAPSQTSRKHSQQRGTRCVSARARRLRKTLAQSPSLAHGLGSAVMLCCFGRGQVPLSITRVNAKCSSWSYYCPMT